MNKYLLALILFFSCCGCCFKAFPQSIQPRISNHDSIGYLKVTGDVESNNKPLENSVISLFENNSKVNQISTLADGTFMLKLAYNKHYSLEITKPGLVVKKFEFDTHLPDSINKNQIFPFIFKIVLFPKYKDIDLSILDKPLAIINYSRKFNDFFYDYNYAKSINDKVVSIQTKIEEFSKQYDKFIETADKYYILKQYKDAIRNYKKALELFPDEPEPQEKINSINKIIKK